jgi:hypothetical protein
LSFFLSSCGEAKTQKEGERREEEEFERRARNDRQKYPQTLHREIGRGGNQGGGDGITGISLDIILLCGQVTPRISRGDEVDKEDR